MRKLSKQAKIILVIAVIISLVVGGFIGTNYLHSKQTVLRLNWNFRSYVSNADNCEDEIYQVLSKTKVKSHGFHISGYSNTLKFYDCSLSRNECSCELKK